MKPKKTTLYIGVIALLLGFMVPQVGAWFFLIIFLCVVAAIAIAMYIYEYAIYYNNNTVKVLCIISDLVIMLVLYPLLHDKIHLLNRFANQALIPLIFSVMYLGVTFKGSIKFAKELWKTYWSK